MEPLNIPLGLRSAIESGNAVLFVGAGIGANAADADGRPGPNASQLAAELATQFGIAAGSNPELAKVAQIVELRKGRADLDSFLAKRLASLEPDPDLQWLFGRRWSAIYTTNYDRLIERAYELLAEPPQNPVPISVTSDLVQADLRFEVPIYHLHGSLYHGDTPALIITDADYARFRERRRMLFELLKQHFATTGFVYVGYSMRDPNWRMLQEELRTEFYPQQPPRAYKIASSTDVLDREILMSTMDIESIDCTLSAFVAAAGTTVAAPGSDADRLSQIQAQVPRDLMASFEANPAAVARLLSSWEYANAADFNREPNVASFLAGDLPNWGLAASDVAFERDIESDLLDALLDFATGEADRPTSLLLTGAAGYGTSTVLLRIAARLVSERAGPVFMHRRGTPLGEGDIEFATRQAAEPPFFVIDNAADVSNEVISAVRRLRDSRIGACFVLGERTNEWRQATRRLSPIEYEIESLSDAEITRLLAALGRHNALGVLGDLDPDLRFSVVKDRHEKQLLVAMREATEGRGFDAIIEDEYRSIGDAFSRRLYAAVCCFYRLRMRVRAEVLSSLVDCSLVELYARVTPALEGVVTWESVSEDVEVARARHHSIAEIVWDRALESGERDDLVLKAMGSLNLAYRSDAQSFERFVRNDRMVDALLTFETKTRFFETAMRKAPDDAYVRQHYARMLLREAKSDLALAQIEQAIKQAPGLRVLRHTKGGILRDMALNTDSLEIARRRLAQSEQAYRQSFGALLLFPWVR